jgi:type IV/VI secretion system ImpK/VasF family protein
MAETTDRSPSVLMTEMCWPVFEFLTNFIRQVKHGIVPPPEQVRFEALSALRDAEELARDDPVAERGWHDRVKAMMVYLLDYKMLNTEWDGRDYWFDHRFETSPDGLSEVEALGGEKFFEQCDEIQREYELAERRDRRDKDELAAQLNLYFICLRLGFKGKFHDYPQELADYTRRLFTRLPSYSATRSKEMFPDAYRHNQELKVDYKLGMSLAVVLAIFALIIGSALITFRLAWNQAVGDIAHAAEAWEATGEKVE